MKVAHSNTELETILSVTPHSTNPGVTVHNVVTHNGTANASISVEILNSIT